jgi:hypothetical protein
MGKPIEPVLDCVLGKLHRTVASGVCTQDAMRIRERYEVGTILIEESIVIEVNERGVPFSAASINSMLARYRWLPLCPKNH